MSKVKLPYYTNRHSCYLLQYHLVLVTKYRHPVLSGALETELIDYTKNYFSKQNMHIIEINCCQDHIHILFEAPPQISLSKLVNAYKSASSRYVRTNFKKELAPFYWKPYFWSLSYFIATVSGRTTNIVSEYIKNQKKQQ